MRRLACDQSREQPCALGPYDLQSARLRQLAFRPGGHHGPQAQLLHQACANAARHIRAAAGTELIIPAFWEAKLCKASTCPIHGARQRAGRQTFTCL